MRGFFSCLVVLVLASGVMAATMDYQGGSTVMTAADWYQLNVSWDPSSTTGLPRWPTTGDQCMLRNGAAATLNTFLECDRFTVGGYEILDTSGGSVVPMPPSTLNLASDAHLKIVTGSSVQFNTGNRYTGIVNQYPGSLVEMDEKTAAGGDGKTNFQVASSTDDAVGTYNMYGGTLDLKGDQYVNFNIGCKPGATGVFNMYDGLVSCQSVSKGYVYLGRGGSTSGDGNGTFNMMGGSFICDSSDQKTNFYIGRYAGEGHLNVTGGYMFVGKRMYVGVSKSGSGYTTGTASFTGGTLHMRDSLEIGSGDNVSSTGEGHVTFGQDFSMISTGWMYHNGVSSSLEVLISSAKDFDILFTGNVILDMARLDGIVTVQGGYTPTAGQSWKVIDAGNAVVLSNPGPLQSSYPTGRWYFVHDTANQDLRLLYIPEPATLSLLALGGLALIRRRRS